MAPVLFTQMVKKVTTFEQVFNYKVMFVLDVKNEEKKCQEVIRIKGCVYCLSDCCRPIALHRR